MKVLQVGCALLVFAACLDCVAGPAPQDDPGARAKQAKVGLLEAIDRGMKEAGTGVIYAVELEPDEGKLVYSIDVAQGSKTRNVTLDAATGVVVHNVLESDDQSRLVAAFTKLGLKEGVQAAVDASKGTPVSGWMKLDGQAPQFAVTVVGPDGKSKEVLIDGNSGQVVAAAAAPVREYTDTFAEDRSDLGPTGRNPYFLLEPGRFWMMEGKHGSGTLRVTYTVLAQTKRIDGVECGVLESREELDGQLVELTLDYHAFSKRTGNVYYFGEDVDEYRDGKVVGHDGTWIAGEKGARWGLFTPAVPLLGSRYYQEIAPGVARDRVEIQDTAAVVTTPAGTFKDVLVFEETNPEEPGHVDHKYFSRDAGFMVKEEESSVLVRFGKK